jgi:mRNA-degrading endonuclease toxin of MazEF toxin-antitoxin module
LDVFDYRRGEVYRYDLGEGHPPVTVVLLSRDAINQTPPDGLVWVAPLGRHQAPLAVACSEADPVAGWVLLHAHRTVERDRLSDPVGILTGATMTKIGDMIAYILEDAVPDLD